MESHRSYTFTLVEGLRRALFPPYSLVNAAQVENCRLGRANLVSRAFHERFALLDDFSQ
jgi:hypothetical protein